MPLLIGLSSRIQPKGAGYALQLRAARFITLAVEDGLQLHEGAEALHLVQVDAGVLEEVEAAPLAHPSALTQSMS